MARNHPREQINALLALITSTVHDALSEYEKTEDGIPTLDAPYTGDTKYPTPALRKAICTLEGACDQLCSTLAESAHTMLNRSLAHIEPACIRTVTKARVADILVDHPNGLHVNELAAKAGIDGHKLARILRYLATRHCFREVDVDVFANNRLSLTLTQDKYMNIVDLLTYECARGPPVLYEALVLPEYATSDESSKAPLLYAIKDEGISGNFWDWINAHPERDVVFGRAMIEWSRMAKSNAVVEKFPWKNLPAGATVCDVGGGFGSFSLELARAHPHLSITLQDLPETIEQAKKIWSMECPEAIAEQRIDFVPLNFLKDRPAEGKDIYYLKHVIHDWSDEKALVILRGVRQAMHNQSRLFIQETLLRHLHLGHVKERHEGDRQAIADIAPKPLLPNYGIGKIQEYSMDINLMCSLNSKERTLEDFIDLTRSAGLKLVKVWDLTKAGVLEFTLQDIQ